MIKEITYYETSDGSHFENYQKARVHENDYIIVFQFLKDFIDLKMAVLSPDIRKIVINILIKNRKHLTDILT